MSLTKTTLRQLQEDRPRRVRLTQAGERRPIGPSLTEDRALPARWARRLGLAWIVVFAVAVAVEPAPPADAPEPLWASFLFLALMGALGTMAAGLARGWRLGLMASMAAAGLALIGTVMCPVSGHHPGVGAWWGVQMIGFTGLMAASLMGLRRARPVLE
jgi:peptidoglycan/LPS O-acetylase OafA/YrhL